MKQGIVKYIPDFLLAKYKAKILDDIYINEKPIGYIMGNNIMEVDFNDNEEVDNYIRNIKKISPKDISTIYIEGCDSFRKQTLDYIESNTGYKFASGQGIRTNNIEPLLIKTSKLLNRELGKNDLLIICSDKNRLIDIIKKLPKELNCIANLGVEEDNLYEEILKDTGVSIYEPYNIDKAIKNFHYIINYSEEIYFDISKIRSHTIVVDFSRNRSMNGLKKTNKNIIYIEDFNFSSGLDSKWIDKYISSMIYETIYASEFENFSQVYADGAYWYLDEYLNLKIKRRGRL